MIIYLTFIYVLIILYIVITLSTSVIFYVKQFVYFLIVWDYLDRVSKKDP